MGWRATYQIGGCKCACHIWGVQLASLGWHTVGGRAPCHIRVARRAILGSWRTVGVSVHAMAVLLAVHPLPGETVAPRPKVGAFAVGDALGPLAIIHAACNPWAISGQS
eukprot:5988301-Prymnesium_polylepis.1